MPTTYLEAISAWQQRSIDAMKVAQSTQVTSLQTALDYATAFSAPRSPVSLVPGFVSDMTALMTGFTFQFLAQQVAYTKQLVDTIAAPAGAGAAPVSALATSHWVSAVALPEPERLPELPPAAAALMLTSAEPAATDNVSAQPPAGQPAAGEPAVSEPMSTKPQGHPDGPETAFPTRPELVAETHLETQATMPSVSNDFSSSAELAEQSTEPKVKPVPASSANASAKPQKAASVSNARPVKRSSKLK